MQGRAGLRRAGAGGGSRRPRGRWVSPCGGRRKRQESRPHRTPPCTQFGPESVGEGGDTGREREPRLSPTRPEGGHLKAEGATVSPTEGSLGATVSRAFSHCARWGRSLAHPQGSCLPGPSATGQRAAIRPLPRTGRREPGPVPGASLPCVLTAPPCPGSHSPRFRVTIPLEESSGLRGTRVG